MALYMDASEQALVTTFSTSTTRQEEPSLAENVLYQMASPVLRTTDAAQHSTNADKGQHWAHEDFLNVQRISGM